MAPFEIPPAAPNAAHSWFAPSAAHRALKCPGSVKASQGLARTGNIHADRGTECHRVMELSLGFGELTIGEGMLSAPQEQEELCVKAWDMLKAYLDQEGLDRTWVERELNLSAFDGRSFDIFGTADVVALNAKENLAAIIDFKFGYSEVDSEMNEQLMMYALMAVRGLPAMAEVERVKLVVIQPKVSDTPSVWEISEPDLIAWAEQTLMPGIELAKSEYAPFNPGESQCRWCPAAKAGCKYQTDKYLTALEPLAPQDTFKLDDDKLTKLLVMVPAMEAAVEAVKVAAIDRLKSGSPALRQHFKLVERSTRRRWVNEEEALVWLKKRRKLRSDEYMKEQVKGPAAIEKLVAKLNLNKSALDEFAALIEKPAGEITYAPLSDKRTAIEIDERKTLIDDINNL